MRGIMGLFAAVLSFLLVSSPLVASGCDLVCSMRQYRSGCHTPNTVSPGQRRAMAMAPGMKMDSSMNMESMSMPMDGQPVLDRRTLENPSGHSMVLELGMPSGRFDHLAKPEVTSSNPHSTNVQTHSENPSSCTNGACSARLSTTSSPPRSEGRITCLRVVHSNSLSCDAASACYGVGFSISPPTRLSPNLSTVLRI